MVRTKAKQLIYRFEVLLDNWEKEIVYCKKELKEVKNMVFNKK